MSTIRPDTCPVYVLTAELDTLGLEYNLVPGNKVQVAAILSLFAVPYNLLSPTPDTIAKFLALIYPVLPATLQ